MNHVESWKLIYPKIGPYDITSPNLKEKNLALSTLALFAINIYQVKGCYGEGIYDILFHQSMGLHYIDL